MHNQNISRFLRNHFHLGPQRVRMLSKRRLIIQVAGLHRSSGGKLPNANKGRFDTTTFQLALNMSHSKVLKKATLIINIMKKVIIELSEFDNKVFLKLINKIFIEFILIFDMS